MVHLCCALTHFVAAFDYDYNALDGGEQSALAKGYDNLL